MRGRRKATGLPHHIPIEHRETAHTGNEEHIDAAAAEFVEFAQTCQRRQTMHARLRRASRVERRHHPKACVRQNSQCRTDPRRPSITDT
jgi:hypothetical protein